MVNGGVISTENLSNVKIALPVSQKTRSKKTFVPITFGIAETPGKQVKIAGSFNNWQPEATQYNPITGHYEYIYSFDLDILELTPEEKLSIQYKYIVDGEWKINEKVESASDDAGNVNNLLCISAVADEITWDESVIDPFSSISQKKHHRMKTLVHWIKRVLGWKAK